VLTLLGIPAEVAGDGGVDTGASGWNGSDIAGCDVSLKEAPQLVQ
jgi:hypothetical protein